ncbi:TPA: DUF3438 family protein [Shewanella algae]|uniref:DUF3438 family protein n=1 Tax=Shewanella TaxID=22 RepID=UPI001431715E|nr:MULTISPECIES: DUF3438 family protein [Shewanella]NJI86964.1 DUF3438 family protein [Shewanella sp. Iso12]HDS1208458.1 DUF3438 family protein [Shewanella algae]
MNTIKSLPLLLLLTMFVVFSKSSFATEHVKWRQGEEISLLLGVGIERKVVFPEIVRFAYKPKYKEFFSKSMIDRNFYIKPMKEFSNEKLVFQGISSGRFYIVETSVTGDSGRVDQDLVVHIPDSEAHDGLDDDSRPELPNTAEFNGRDREINPVDLVQYASQSLYSKSEVYIENLPGVKRVALKSRELPHIYRGGSLKGELLAGWSAGGLFVTAIKLTNVSSTEVYFEPCRLRGDFYSVTAQFNKVYPYSNPNKNFTVAYVVTEVPFDVAIKGGLQCV